MEFISTTIVNIMATINLLTTSRPLMIRNTLTLLLFLGISGCHTNGMAPPDPCLTDPNLNGCVGSISSSTTSLNPDNAAAVVSSTLQDIISISQVALIAAIKGNELKTDIQSAPTTQPIINPEANDETGPFRKTFPCDNSTANSPHDYFISIQNLINPSQQAPERHMEGATMTISFDGTAIGSNITPGVYCTIGNMNISGFMYLTRTTFPTPSQADNWTMTGEIWPTLVIHNDTILTTIANNMALEVSYTTGTGLVVTGTVMSNPYLTSVFTADPIDGMVFTHFQAGDDPNTSPTSTYTILNTGYVINGQIDNAEPLFDLLATSQLSFTAAGTISSDRTGTEIDMQVQTVDASATSQPFVWSNNLPEAPKIAPPTSGALFIEDISTTNSIAATISNTPGNVDLVITDNAFAPNTSGHITSQTAYWVNLMAPH